MMYSDDSNRYFGVDEIINQNNEAYLKGVGFVTAPEDVVFTPSSAKPEQGWGVHGPKETKGGRTKTEEWETIGSAHLESDLIMDKNTKAIFHRVDSVLKAKEIEIKAQLSQISQKLTSVEKDLKDLNKARFSQSVNLLAEDLDNLKAALEERFEKAEIGISSAHTKEVILRRDLYEEISKLKETVKELEDDVKVNIDGPEEAYLKACSLEEEIKLIKQSHNRNLSYLKDTVEAIKRQTAFGPEFEHFKTMSNHKISQLEGTINSLQDQISTLQRETIANKQEQPSDGNTLKGFVWGGILFIVIMGFISLRL
jgi:hypothetical protein